MNSELLRAIYKKKMLFNKFNKYKGRKKLGKLQEAKELYYKTKEIINKKYFYEWCSGGPHINLLCISSICRFVSPSSSKVKVEIFFRLWSYPAIQ